MLNINNELHKYNIKPTKYIIKNNIIIVETVDNKYVLKKRVDNQIYDYLNSRGFIYYPKIISTKDDEYEITKYIESSNIPKEQKIEDLIELVSLLHIKTTHYKEVDIEDNKIIYEDISNNIDYLYSYYNDLMTIIESKVYFSPPEYLLARNISKVYQALNFCKNNINRWYEKVKTQKKQRQVVLHNNLSLDHFIRNDTSYLISWNKAKIDSPIFDIYKLYKKHSLDFDFSSLLIRYEKKYPLLDEERDLLFTLLALPDKIEFDNNNYNMCVKINNFIDEINKTEILISPYYSKNTPQN